MVLSEGSNNNLKCYNEVSELMHYKYALQNVIPNFYQQIKYKIFKMLAGLKINLPNFYK